MGKIIRLHMITKTTKLFIIIFLIAITTLNSCSESDANFEHNANNYPLLVDDGGSGTVGNTLNRAGDSWIFGILCISNISETAITINHVGLTDEENMITKDYVSSKTWRETRAYWSSSLAASS